MQTIAVAGTKGGAGTTVVAAALAITHHHHTRTRAIVAGAADPHRADQLAAVFGAAGQPTDPFECAPGIVLDPGTTTTDPDPYGLADLAVTDCGTLAAMHAPGAIGTEPRTAWLAAAARVLVTRADYLGLRAATHHGGLLTPGTVAVLVDEPGRSLTRREVADVLGVPVIARIPLRDTVARAVDAGVLAARLPDVLARPAALILARTVGTPAQRMSGHIAQMATD